MTDPRSPYWPLLGGLAAHVFWLVAVFGFLRTVVDDAVAGGMAVLLGGLAGHWFAAFFSGGGHSGRRAFMATALAGTVVIIAGLPLVVLVGEIGAGEGAVLWAGAWLVGAALAVRHRESRQIAWRIGLVAVAGVPILIGTVAVAGTLGTPALLVLPLLAWLFPIADRLTAAGARVDT